MHTHTYICVVSTLVVSLFCCGRGCCVECGFCGEKLKISSGLQVVSRISSFYFSLSHNFNLHIKYTEVRKYIKLQRQYKILQYVVEFVGMYTRIAEIFMFSYSHVYICRCVCGGMQTYFEAYLNAWLYMRMDFIPYMCMCVCTYIWICVWKVMEL